MQQIRQNLDRNLFIHVLHDVVKDFVNYAIALIGFDADVFFAKLGLHSC